MGPTPCFPSSVLTGVQGPPRLRTLASCHSCFSSGIPAPRQPLPFHTDPDLHLSLPLEALEGSCHPLEQV